MSCTNDPENPARMLLAATTEMPAAITRCSPNRSTSRPAGRAPITRSKANTLTTLAAEAVLTPKCRANAGISGATIPNPSATVNETAVRMVTSAGMSRKSPRWSGEARRHSSRWQARPGSPGDPRINGTPRSPPAMTGYPPDSGRLAGAVPCSIAGAVAGVLRGWLPSPPRLRAPGLPVPRRGYARVPRRQAEAARRLAVRSAAARAGAGNPPARPPPPARQSGPPDAGRDDAGRGPGAFLD